MIHLDLFSGIGGFAYAADQVFGGGIEHIFCDNDKFCRQILKKHWPEAKIYDDIRNITDTELKRLERRGQHTAERRQDKRPLARPESTTDIKIDVLTGGFPCQPFSAAGLRRGTADDRHLWPEMLRVIRLTKPEWVIAENVRGILTWNDGLVFEQVCADLEAQGYAVWPFIIPAVAVNAPHRRDRVWFVGKLIDAAGHGLTGLDDAAQAEPSRRTETELNPADRHATDAQSQRTQRWNQQHRNTELDENNVATKDAGRQRGRGRSDGDPAGDDRQIQDARSSDARAKDASDGSKPGLERRSQEEPRYAGQRHRAGSHQRPDWSQDWLEVAAELCGVDDGLPARLDGFELTKSKHRQERLKSLGNAIVPQIAIEIMQGIKLSNHSNILT